MVPPIAKSVPLSTILNGDTRLEASTYLREGYGFVRLANQCAHHMKLGDLADIWQPSRLTGYTMSDGKGLPFLTAGQVFEDFPRIRKWLAKPFVSQSEMRKVKHEWLLLSCSGVVGNVTAVYPHHLDKIVTHDLLRVVPKEASNYGWLYAYMKTDFFKQIARASQYGHMIKHIEANHANEFPVILPEAAALESIGRLAKKAIDLRIKAWKLRDEAFEKFESNFELATIDEEQAAYGEFDLSSVLQNRQRLDASYFARDIPRIEKAFAQYSSVSLGEVTLSASALPRFSRFYGDTGTPYVSASELFDVNAKPTKHIYSKLVKNYERYMLKPNMIIMACSGQKYGILGRSIMLTDKHAGLFGSHDLLRIMPDISKMRPGYLLTFLNDPSLGRPYVVRNAYGTSIPHLDPADIQRIKVPRLPEVVESDIADTMERSVKLGTEADRLENEAINHAQAQIDLAISEIASPTKAECVSLDNERYGDGSTIIRQFI